MRGKAQRESAQSAASPDFTGSEFWPLRDHCSPTMHQPAMLQRNRAMRSWVIAILLIFPQRGPKLHQGSRRGVVGTLPNFSWTYTHHRSYTILNGVKKYCFVSKLRPKNVKKSSKNQVQISRFLTPAKIRGESDEILAVRYRVRPRP